MSEMPAPTRPHQAKISTVGRYTFAGRGQHLKAALDSLSPKDRDAPTNDSDLTSLEQRKRLRRPQPPLRSLDPGSARKTQKLVPDKLLAQRVNLVHFTPSHWIYGHPLQVRLAPITAKDVDLGTGLFSVAHNDFFITWVLAQEIY